MQHGGHHPCKVTSARYLVRARSLTSASARQRPACPGPPRNAIFLSCPCGCRACRRPGGLGRRLRAGAVPGPVMPARAMPAGRFRVLGRHAVTVPAGRPDAATRPAGAVLAAAGYPWGVPGGGAVLRRLPGAVAGRLPGRPQAYVRASGGQRTRARTSSRMAVMASWLGASTLRRSKGSVLEGRRLNQRPSPRLTVSPSSRSLDTPGRA